MRAKSRPSLMNWKSNKMKREEFRAWLKDQGFRDGVISSRVSNCNWIEKNVPKVDPSFLGLDEAFDMDGCRSLVNMLEFDGGPHLLAPHIGNGEVNIKNSLSTYRSALKLYIEFRQGIVHDKRTMNDQTPSKPSHTPAKRTLHGNTAPIPEECGPIAALWKQHSESREALTLALGRTSNVLGEIAERVVADYYDGKLLTASTASADIELDDGTMIQVKARIPRQGMTTSLSAIRSWNFDRLAVLLFNNSGSILFAGEINADAAMEHATEVPHTNSWNITTTDAFLTDPRMVVLTDEYNSVLTRL